MGFGSAVNVKTDCFLSLKTGIAGRMDLVAFFGGACHSHRRAMMRCESFPDCGVANAGAATATLMKNRARPGSGDRMCRVPAPVPCCTQAENPSDSTAAIAADETTTPCGCALPGFHCGLGCSRCLCGPKTTRTRIVRRKIARMASGSANRFHWTSVRCWSIRSSRPAGCLRPVPPIPSRYCCPSARCLHLAPYWFRLFLWSFGSPCGDRRCSFRGFRFPAHSAGPSFPPWEL